MLADIIFRASRPTVAMPVVTIAWEVYRARTARRRRYSDGFISAKDIANIYGWLRR